MLLFYFILNIVEPSRHSKTAAFGIKGKQCGGSTFANQPVEPGLTPTPIRSKLTYKST